MRTRRFPKFVLMHSAGLAATAYVVWMGAVAPRLKFESVGQIVASAFAYAGLAWAFSAGLTLLLCAAFLGWKWEAAVSMALRTSRIAVWFAPACILVSHLSPMALIPALTLIFGTTQLLHAEWRRAQPAPPEVWQPPPYAFQPLPSAPRLRVMALPVIVALVLQSTVTAQMMKYYLSAAVFLSVAVALCTLLLLNAGVLKGEQAGTLPRAVFGVILTLILAAGLTAAYGIVHHRPGLPGWGFGGGETAVNTNPIENLRELMRSLFGSGGNAADDDPSAPRDAPGKGIVEAFDDVFPGIVLQAEPKSYTLLVAPSPSWLRKSSAPAAAAQTYSIPFSGEYWMFRPPFTRPPRGAKYQPGNPAELSFKTNDHSRMLMEARQRLDRSLPLSCCASIRVQVLNADRFPGTISLELELIDRLPQGEQSTTLGNLPLSNWPVIRPRKPPGDPVYDTLEFPVPASAAIQQFNELRLVLHREMVRNDRSARVSIERFILVPRLAR